MFAQSSGALERADTDMPVLLCHAVLCHAAQVLAACSAHDLPTESIEVMGGGVMEWTQHR
jgi:hypothetical protein